MKTTARKIVTLLVIMCISAGLFVIPSSAEEINIPNVYIELLKGESTTSSGSVNSSGVKYIRVVSANASELESVVNKIAVSGIKAPQSALKFDRKSTADQVAQRKIRDLYTDNGHFTDPSTITVSGAPAGYPFQYVGFGDYSGHYVSHIRVVYERDEAGNPVKDENGNFVIKELQHSSGTPLTYKGEPTTNINGPFDYATGTRSQQFLLMNEAGETVYAYCVDLGTPTADKKPYYAVANLENVDYYASEDAEAHIRAITQNGYWGTSEGMGSLDYLKTALKAALAEGKIEKTHTIEFMNRVKYKEGMELTEGQYRAGSYVVWYLPVQEVTLTDEIIDGLTEGEALDAMQAAIWSYANGSNYALDGTDRMIVGDPYYASCAAGDSRNGQNDFEGAARTKALMSYLMSLETYNESTVVINKENFIKDMSLIVGDHLGDGVYNVALNFRTYFTANIEKDDLSIELEYVDANGETQTITKKLTGDDALTADENGYYTLEGLTLKSGEEFDFSLNVFGAQFLEKGTYIYTAELGVSGSQTMVGVAEGTNIVDIVASMSVEFEVEEYELKAVGVELMGIKYLDEEAYAGFDFAIADKDGEIQTVKSNEEGIFSFDTLVFAEEGEYVYTIYEIADESNKEIYYDESIYTVTVNVEIVDRAIVAEVTVEKDGEAHEGDIVFNNLTIPDIPDNPPPLNPPTGDTTVILAIFAFVSIAAGSVLVTAKRREI